MTIDDSGDDETEEVTSTQRKARRGFQNTREIMHSAPVRRAVVTVVVANLTVGTAMAQASEAAGMMCQSGLGELIGLGLGAAVVLLLLLAAFRGTMAFKDLGQGRSEKKREGREKMMGAGITAVGAFFPAIFGMALDRVGIGAFSCIEWSGIIGMTVTVAPF
ncbi:hypothetical protein [Haloterrigena salifodinae]|uniref:hypothetical protein n=1 Tax=Haloterrigena salifodinae TaxID=2675099 RepID=UPI000F8812AC|nr:hypothetical protein [Haloterrigena salifodinae]